MLTKSGVGFMLENILAPYLADTFLAILWVAWMAILLNLV